MRKEHKYLKKKQHISASGFKGAQKRGVQFSSELM